MKYTKEEVELNAEATFDYLKKKGYHNLIEEANRLNKKYANKKKISQDDKIELQRYATSLQKAVTKEIDRAKEEGTFDLEAQGIMENINHKKARKQEYKDQYGEVPKGYTVDEAYELAEAEKAFEQDPSMNNSARLLSAKNRGDTGRRNLEATEIDMEEHQRAMSEIIENEIKRQEDNKARLAGDVEEIEARKKELMKQGNDPRFGRDMPMSPRDREIQEEERKKKIFRGDFDRNYGF